MADQKYHDDDDDKELLAASKKKFQDWDCPDCNANNLLEELTSGEELLCNYCGTTFRATITDEGKLKLREA